MGDLRTSAIWIQEGTVFGFFQTFNPGPTHLIDMRESESEFRKQLRAVLDLRAAMDRAVANEDPASRSRQLAALFRSGNRIARPSALQKLERGGDAEKLALVDLLSDDSLLDWHQEIVAALIGMRVIEAPFAELILNETAYWSATCPAMKPGWWNDMRWPEVNKARSHYTRAYALLKAVRELNLTAALPEANDLMNRFTAVWATCPSPDPRRESNQITDELKHLQK
jgi:hypothetical protein